MTVYRALPEELVIYATAAGKYFNQNFGLKSPEIEVEIHENVSYRPTLKFIDPDKNIICVEIVEKVVPMSLSPDVLSCRNLGLPVKFWMAFPQDLNEQLDGQGLRFARDNGVGLLSLKLPSIGNQHTTAISQSVCGLRNFSLSEYPGNRRHSLKSAIETFKSADPAKGCAAVYDELEAVSRSIGRKAAAKTNGLKQIPGFSWDTAPWNNVIAFLKANFDRAVMNCPELKPTIFAKVETLTALRNEVGHKPKTLAKLIERDRKLRTRFEEAMDALLDLTQAAKPMRV